MLNCKQTKRKQIRKSHRPVPKNAVLWQLLQNKKCVLKHKTCKAKVVEAQAEVPKALAEAFRNGNLGVMDYYNMNNIIADTKMRENLADGE